MKVNESKAMDIDVYDTYVRTADGELLHFDVFVPAGDGIKARQYAYEWLLDIGRTPRESTLEKCAYCHTVTAKPEIQQRIDESGYYILPMEGCPDQVD